jgi:hypothetical protein
MGGSRTKIDQALLDKWRNLEASYVLVQISDYAKQDTTFIPIKNNATSRWNANVQGRDIELLLTGPKFWDTRANKGGGGAVDLVIHLHGVDFRGAVKLLKKRGL